MVGRRFSLCPAARAEYGSGHGIRFAPFYLSAGIALNAPNTTGAAVILFGTLTEARIPESAGFFDVGLTFGNRRGFAQLSMRVSAQPDGLPVCGDPRHHQQRDCVRFALGLAF
jgi:hypothetical protein